MVGYQAIHGGLRSTFYSPHQFTPLHSAAEEGHVDIVRYLVDKGADLNVKDEIGVSTLLTVNYYCWLEFVSVHQTKTHYY